MFRAQRENGFKLLKEKRMKVNYRELETKKLFAELFY